MKHQWGHRSGTGEYRNLQQGPDAEIYGSPTIHQSEIYGHAKVFGGEIYDSVLDGNVIVSGGRIIKSAVVGDAIVEGASVFQSFLQDGARALDMAKLNGATLRDFATVCGSAVVIGTPLEGFDYLDRGIWYRRPITYVSKGGFIVTENVGQLVTVSCTTNTTRKWLNGAGRRYGKVLGLPPEEIEEIEFYVSEIQKLKEQPDYDMRGQ